LMSRSLKNEWFFIDHAFSSAILAISCVLAMSYLCQKFTKCPLYLYIRAICWCWIPCSNDFFSAESSQAQNSPGKWLGQHISPQHFIQPPLEDDDLSIVTRRGHTQPAMLQAVAKHVGESSQAVSPLKTLAWNKCTHRSGQL
jgi:hypothetical protein